jgi:hypothetical protein
MPKHFFFCGAGKDDGGIWTVRPSIQPCGLTRGNGWANSVLLSSAKRVAKDVYGLNDTD